LKEKMPVTKAAAFIRSGAATGAVPREIPDLEILVGRAPAELIGAEILYDRYETVICNAGLSTLSELLSRGIMPFVLPLPRHLEQELNSQWIENAGLGKRWAGCPIIPAPAACGLPKPEHFLGARVIANHLLRDLLPAGG
jgi:hypothetical protein